ncbi:MAG TPA: hypothetical protein VLA93_06155 [Pyrinomonadaceae bacterium]|nr:hypothetical protein [Pyrinomonadaceae bacterium]
MPVVKKRNQQTETRLLLESIEPIDLPPAKIEDSAVMLQFEKFRSWVPELLHALRSGTIAEPIPIMLDGSTFAIHGQTRTFWVKIWHAAGTDMTEIDRVQVISCLPSTRGVQVLIDTPDKMESFSAHEKAQTQPSDDPE